MKVVALGLRLEIKSLPLTLFHLKYFVLYLFNVEIFYRNVSFMRIRISMCGENCIGQTFQAESVSN